MTYKPEWKGKLRVVRGIRIEWNGVLIGETQQERREGVKSPGGMLTSTIWRAANRDGKSLGEYTSQTEAIQALIDGYKNEVLAVS